MGKAATHTLSNGIILSVPNTQFLCIWFEGYRKYDPKYWGGNSVLMAHALAEIHPNLVHIEENSLLKPGWRHSDLMFEKHYDWSNNYAMHIWKRRGKVPDDPAQMDQLNCTLGEVMRYIYYGSKDLRKPLVTPS